jgi:hypothetical protein
MGRPSKLTTKQWEEIGKRLLAGEKASALAKEFKVSRATISERFSRTVSNVKTVANQIVATQDALKAMPLSEQLSAISLAAELRAISMHMAGAAKFGAATAHRLAGIAHGKVQEIDDADPFAPESMESLKGVAVLTKLSNEAAVIPTALLNANKDTIKELNNPQRPDDREQMLREIAAALPN